MEASLLKGAFVELEDNRQTTIHKGKFPVIWGPGAPHFKGFVALQELFEQYREQILHKVSDVGAVLFRGFDIQSANEYVSVLHKLGLAEFEYIGGAAVRHLVVGSHTNKSLQVFTTNESPPHEPIPLHNELAQNESYPEFISFYCHTEAESGGSTPIINCHELYNYVEKNHPDFIKDLENKGVRYIRVVEENDNLSSPIGRGWRNIFNVETREQAEIVMKERGYEWEWFDSITNDCKLSSKKLPAIRIAKNGEKVFCNQMLAVFKGWIDHKNSPTLCLRYGDDSEIPLSVLEDICLHAPKVMTAIPWSKGDFILIDNELVAHSREPFEGIRKVYATLMKGKAEVKKSANLVLNSGDLMPCVGFGTWKIERQHCASTVYEAIKAGYRLLDCACDYGNEVEVGEGIAKAISENIVSRKDLFITSKLWNTYHRKEHVRDACLRTLKDLKLDYIDLYLVHFPISLKFVPFEHRYPPEWLHDPKAKHPKLIEDHVPIMETWRAMESLIKEKLVQNIGVANFNTSLLRDLLNTCHIRPAVNQVEIHPYLTQKKLIRYCRSNGIQVTSYSTFGATSYIQLGGATASDETLNDPVIQSISARHKRTPGQVILRWAVQQGLAVIPKSSKIERIRENRELEGWQLEESDMNLIDNLNKNRRFNDPGVYAELAFNTFFPIFE